MNRNQIEVHIAEGLVVGPGDALVVKVPSDFDVDTVNLLHDTMKEELNGVKVVIIHGDIEVTKVEGQ